MSNELLSSLAAYMPRDRVEQIARGTALPADGVSLIADVSGFTPLTEALTRGLRAGEGAEALTDALEGIFTPLIREIHAFRGSVIKFAGDALLVWYGREPGQHRSTVVQRALVSAFSMQASMLTHGTVTTPLGPVTLSMKIGLAYGHVKRFELGLPEHGYEDVLVGEAVDRMSEAESRAEPGEVVVDRATADLLRGRLSVATWRENYAVVDGIDRARDPDPWPPLAAPAGTGDKLLSDLAVYVPAQIEETLVAGLDHVSELKPVVSLFVQFHGLQHDDDPDVGEKMQSYFTSAQQIAARHGGRLNRLITGDKGSLLHVIFGAPQAVEAQEQRAVLCALELQAECGGLPFISMQRIGVARDQVIAGPVGAPIRHDYTVMGDAINLSARLMQYAADDQILIETGVRSRLGPNFLVRDLGEIAVKGKADTVATYSVESFETHRTTGAAEIAMPLFGREGEMARLGKRIASLESGRGNVVVLVGESGTGKTHLIETLRSRTEVDWVNGICLAYGQSLSGFLALEMLRDLVGLPQGAGPEKSSQSLLDFCAELFGSDQVPATYPYLARFLGLPMADEYARRIQGLAAESLRWQIFELMAVMLRHLLADSPLLLALDDLQWADPTSLELIESLLPLAEELPLCLILAMHPDRETPAWALRETVLESYPVQSDEMVLGPLALDDSRELLVYLAPDLSPRVGDYLIERSGRNPMFLVELVRTLELQGLLDGVNTLATADLETLDLPDSVQGLLLAQIDRLRVEARRTLQLASVIGKSFLVRVLDAIAAGEAQLDESLLTLQGRGHVREDEASVLGSTYAFRHQLIQESAYSTLLYQRRRAYHRQVAETLEKLFPMQVAEQAGLLAFHYEQAHDLDKAITYHSQAGDAARLLYANEEAEALYGKVLELLDELEVEGGPADPTTSDGRALLDRRAGTYLKLAQVRSGQMNFEEANAYYDRAFELLEQLEQGESRAVESRDQAVFRWGVADHGPLTLDPGLSYVDDLSEIVEDLFEGLVRFDPDLMITPALARRWRVDHTGTVYRFQLREGLRWSDGVPLTAHDFVYAWRRNLDPVTEAPLAYQLYLVRGARDYHQGTASDPSAVGIEAIDDVTVEVQLEKPTSFFLYLLAGPVSFPLPSHVLRSKKEEWADPENLVCSGPFVLAEWQPGKRARLARNRHYRLAIPGNLQSVELPFVMPNPENFVTDRLDFCRMDDRSSISDQADTRPTLIQYLDIWFLAFNCALPPFADPTIRKAFGSSIDRQELVREIWHDVQKPAFGGAVPPGISGHSPEIGLPFDPELARKLLSESGFASGDGFPSVSLAIFPESGGTAEYLRDSWRRHLGIDVEVVAGLQLDEILARLSGGQVQMTIMAWAADYPDSDAVLRQLFHGASANNFWSWRDSAFDALVEQGVTESDFQRRLAHYHEADQILVRDTAAIVPLYYYQAFCQFRPNYRFAGTGATIRSSALRLRNIEQLN